jgi:hypothetical protein
MVSILLNSVTTQRLTDPFWGDIILIVLLHKVIWVQKNIANFTNFKRQGHSTSTMTGF